MDVVRSGGLITRSFFAFLVKIPLPPKIRNEPVDYAAYGGRALSIAISVATLVAVPRR